MNKKTEALLRMKMLDLSENVIKDFEEEGRVYYSERINPTFDGILYWLDNKETWQKFVSDFEKEYNALVYHAQLSHLVFGDCLSLLFVSNYPEEWDVDKKDLENSLPFVYVWNMTDTELSEFGTIGLKPKNGGVTRIA